MSAAALAVPLASLLLKNHPTRAPWAEPLAVALGFAGTVAVLSFLLFRSRDAGSRARVTMGVLALAGFMVLTFTGYLTNVRIRRSEDQAAAVARLKDQMPPGQHLVSFGPIDYLFAYYYGQPIELRSLPAGDRAPGEDDLWFCFNCGNDGRPALPFTWREVTAVVMDRNHSAQPERVVVVGHRLPALPVSNSRTPVSVQGSQTN
jgi:hypothetical protein